jgi:hypothetical protein
MLTLADEVKKAARLNPEKIFGVLLVRQRGHARCESPRFVTRLTDQAGASSDLRLFFPLLGSCCVWRTWQLLEDQVQILDKLLAPSSALG